MSINRAMTGDVSQTNGATVITFLRRPKIIALTIRGSGGVSYQMNSDSTDEGSSHGEAGDLPFIIKSDHPDGITKLAITAEDVSITYDIEVIEEGPVKKGN